MGRHKNPASVQGLMPKQRSLLTAMVNGIVSGKQQTQAELAEIAGYSDRSAVCNALKSENLQRAFDDMCEAAGIDPLKEFRRMNEAMDATKLTPLKGGGVLEQPDWTNRIAAVSKIWDRKYQAAQTDVGADHVVHGDVNIENLIFYNKQVENEKVEAVTVAKEPKVIDAEFEKKEG